MTAPLSRVARAKAQPTDRASFNYRRSDLRKAIIFDRSISPSERLVAAALLEFLNPEKGFAWASIDRLSTDTGLSKSTVIRALKAVEGRYFVVTRAKVKGRNSVNHYYPIWPVEKVCHDDTNAGENGVKSTNKLVSPATPNSTPSGKSTPRVSAREACRSEPAIDWPRCRQEFQKKFGKPLFISRLAGCRHDGAIIIAPSKSKALELHENHNVFFREHGVAGFAAEGDDVWFHDTRPRGRVTANG